MSGRPIDVTIASTETDPGGTGVAPFSVSGVPLGPCSLVEPSRSLTKEYGVVVGHTLVMLLRGRLVS